MPTTTTRGMPSEQLPDLSQSVPSRRAAIPPITAESAAAEPPADRTFPETPNSKLQTPNDVTFTRGPARRPVPPVADPLLQWASGLQTKEKRIYAGWLVEAGKHELLDGAMEQAGFGQVTIKHGDGNLVTHWAVETANVFIVADGVQSMGEMKHTSERYGIAFGWRTLAYDKDRHRPPTPNSPAPRMQSQLRCRVFLRELLTIGFPDPLLLTCRGTVTGDLLTALMRQYDVLDAVDAFRKQAGKPPLNPPFYACSVPLGPGREVTRGSGGQSKEITPMVANIPDPVTRAYVLQHWVKKPWAEMIESLVDGTIAWSVEASRLIAVGDEHAAATSEEAL